MRRAGLTVLAGSATGYGVNLLLTPVISRLFTPETFGLFSAVTALTSVFVGVSTFRLEVRSQSLSDETEARDLLRLAVVAALAWATVITLVMGTLFLLWPFSPWWLTTGPLVALASLQLIGIASWTRQRRYRAVGLATMVQGAATGLIQVGLGWVSGGPGSLLSGFGASRLVWLGALRRGRQPGRTLRATWMRSRHFAAVSGGSALVNSAASQLPILLPSVMLGQVEAGFLAMAIRVFVAPLSIVGQAAATANVGEVGRLLRQGNEGVGRLVRSSVRDLFLLGVGPCSLVAVGGIWAVPIALGPQWSPVGPVMALLSAGALLQFCVSPLSQVLNLTDRARWLLVWDLARLVSVSASFTVPFLLGAGLVLAVAVYSGVLCLLYLVLIHLILRAVRGDREG